MDDKLGFYWNAEFEDEYLITQFDENNKEVKYSEVEKYNENSKLTKFSVISNDNSEIFEVDLANKTLSGPGFSYGVLGSNPTLVYFRRNQVRAEVGTGKILESRVTHHLGIKTTTSEKVMEIFNGIGNVPRKIELHNKKTGKKTNLTLTVEDLK